MNRGGEDAGDGADETGKGIRVAGASGRVEFPDRQTLAPADLALPPGAPQRPGRGWVRCYAVSIFRQRGIDEVKDVNIDANGERARREMAKCSPGGTGWIGGQCPAGGHAQAEPVSLLALPAGSHAWLHPEPRHLAWLKQRPGPKRVGEGIHATGQGQRVR